jgi:hypothetical protein
MAGHSAPTGHIEWCTMADAVLPETTATAVRSSMNLRSAVVAAVAGTALSCSPLHSAQAQSPAINLLRQCEGREPTGAPELGVLACAAYLNGFLDMHGLAEGLGARPAFCLPPAGIENEQAVRVFIQWATMHPEQLHESARVSVLVAMARAFPCS